MPESKCKKSSHYEIADGKSKELTHQVLTEEAILETQEKYRLLVEHSKDTIGQITEKGIWTFINREGLKLLGFKYKKEIIGTSLFDHVSKKDHNRLDNYLKKKKSINFELTINTCDKDSRKTEIQLIPTFVNNKQIFQIIIRDITDQKKTEEQLHNAENLSIVGQLAAGIAHEIRNPLTAIKGFTQVLTENGKNEYTGVILSELDRIEGIVNDLLILAKPQVQKPEVVNVLAIIKNVIVLLGPQASLRNICIEDKTGSEECFITCEADKIKQVMINIINNSMESMPDGGRITIERKQDPHFVHISIKDEGIGISEERIGRLGEPFFSTKESGTGLGLMICNKIIHTHGGELRFHSKMNEGTTVTVSLPI